MKHPSGVHWVVQTGPKTECSYIPTATSRSIAKVYTLRSRVPHRAFEWLERYELKGSRTVLRRLGGSNVPRLPDPSQPN